MTYTETHELSGQREEGKMTLIMSTAAKLAAQTTYHRRPEQAKNKTELATIRTERQAARDEWRGRMVMDPDDDTSPLIVRGTPGKNHSGDTRFFFRTPHIRDAPIFEGKQIARPLYTEGIKFWRESDGAPITRRIFLFRQQSTDGKRVNYVALPIEYMGYTTVSTLNSIRKVQGLAAIEIADFDVADRIRTTMSFDVVESEVMEPEKAGGEEWIKTFLGSNECGKARMLGHGSQFKRVAEDEEYDVEIFETETAVIIVVKAAGGTYWNEVTLKTTPNVEPWIIFGELRGLRLADIAARAEELEDDIEFDKDHLLYKLVTSEDLDMFDPETTDLADISIGAFNVLDVSQRLAEEAIQHELNELCRTIPLNPGAYPSIKQLNDPAQAEAVWTAFLAQHSIDVDEVGEARIADLKDWCVAARTKFEVDGGGEDEAGAKPTQSRWQTSVSLFGTSHKRIDGAAILGYPSDNDALTTNVAALIESPDEATARLNAASSGIKTRAKLDPTKKEHVEAIRKAINSLADRYRKRMGWSA